MGRPLGKHPQWSERGLVVSWGVEWEVWTWRQHRQLFHRMCPRKGIKVVLARKGIRDLRRELF